MRNAVRHSPVSTMRCSELTLQQIYGMRKQRADKLLDLFQSDNTLVSDDCDNEESKQGIYRERHRLEKLASSRQINISEQWFQSKPTHSSPRFGNDKPSRTPYDKCRNDGTRPDNLSVDTNRSIDVSPDNSMGNKQHQPLARLKELFDYYRVDNKADHDDLGDKADDGNDVSACHKDKSSKHGDQCTSPQHYLLRTDQNRNKLRRGLLDLRDYPDQLHMRLNNAHLLSLINNHGINNNEFRSETDYANQYAARRREIEYEARNRTDRMFSLDQFDLHNKLREDDFMPHVFHRDNISNSVSTTSTGSVSSSAEYERKLESFTTISKKERAISENYPYPDQESLLSFYDDPSDNSVQWENNSIKIDKQSQTAVKPSWDSQPQQQRQQKLNRREWSDVTHGSNDRSLLSNISDHCLYMSPAHVVQAIAQARRENEDGQLSPVERLGEGSNGLVLKGQLTCGTPVAVKIISLREDPSDEQQGGFERELTTLSMYRHPNIVCLIGFSTCERQRVLVYECLELGDLSRILHSNSAPSADIGSQIYLILRSWKRRLEVAIDAAQALAFLHTRHPKVFHRDIKAGNILLGRNGTAKLADFGLAERAKLESPDKIIIAKPQGTPGYVDPCIIETFEVDESTEVFSFGMVLLELLTGQPPAAYIDNSACAPDASAEQGRLLTYFIDRIDIDSPPSVLPFLDTRCPWPHLVSIEWAKLALRCIRTVRKKRPGTVDVLRRLKLMYATAKNVSLSESNYLSSMESSEFSSVVQFSENQRHRRAIKVIETGRSVMSGNKMTKTERQINVLF